MSLVMLLELFEGVEAFVAPRKIFALEKLGLNCVVVKFLRGFQFLRTIPLNTEGIKRLLFLLSDLFLIDHFSKILI